MQAIYNKETEKAVNITFVVELYGESLTVKNQWMPKSQINIKSIEDGVITFDTKNDWILDAKVRDYCKFVASLGKCVSAVKTYLSPINNVTVTVCWPK